MANNSYRLRYLPLFYTDLEEKVTYIADKLRNPQAAILARVDVAESFEPYHSLKERHYPYYRIYVDNYVIYYVVIADEGAEKIMEVRRFLYKGQDRDTII